MPARLLLSAIWWRLCRCEVESIAAIPQSLTWHVLEPPNSGAPASVGVFRVIRKLYIGNHGPIRFARRRIHRIAIMNEVMN